MAGKGSRYRPINQAKFSENWSKIFGDFELCVKCGSIKVKHRICKECFGRYVRDSSARRMTNAY